MSVYDGTSDKTMVAFVTMQGQGGYMEVPASAAVMKRAKALLQRWGCANISEYVGRRENLPSQYVEFTYKDDDGAGIAAVHCGDGRAYAQDHNTLDAVGEYEN
jgi:hypothetical protein